MMLSVPTSWGSAERELLVLGDGLPDPAAADVLLGLLDDLDPVGACAHARPVLIRA
ncbi:MAG: hypothetical protein MZV64_67845 [Ignavibacteriales bacterium]|nr:hypothetical protein [Ignavibacteriales bacterium]